MQSILINVAIREQKTPIKSRELRDIQEKVRE